VDPICLLDLSHGMRAFGKKSTRVLHATVFKHGEAT